jgi:plasmid maintenance system antidote protein VapI
MNKQQQLSDFLQSNGMTQTEFASKMGMRRETISRVTSGHEPVTNSFIGRFAQVFGFDAARQVFDDGQPQEQPA